MCVTSSCDEQSCEILGIRLLNWTARSFSPSKMDGGLYRYFIFRVTAGPSASLFRRRSLPDETCGTFQRRWVHEKDPQNQAIAVGDFNIDCNLDFVVSSLNSAPTAALL